MAKKRTTTKTTKTAKRSTKTVKGRGGLKSANKFDWKRALPIIALLAVVGSALVYQSFAAMPSGETCVTLGRKQGIPDEYSGYVYDIDWLKKVYNTTFKEIPTEAEQLKWMERGDYYRKKAGNDDAKLCFVRWEVFKEVRETVPENQSKVNRGVIKGTNVIATITADKMNNIVYNGYQTGRYGYSSRLSTSPNSTTTDLTYLGYRNNKHKNVSTYVKNDNWPENIKVCAVYRFRGNQEGPVTLDVLAVQGYTAMQQINVRSGLVQKICTDKIPTNVPLHKNSTSKNKLAGVAIDMNERSANVGFKGVLHLDYYQIINADFVPASGGTPTASNGATSNGKPLTKQTTPVTGEAKTSTSNPVYSRSESTSGGTNSSSANDGSSTPSSNPGATPTAFGTTEPAENTGATSGSQDSGMRSKRWLPW